MLRYEQLGGGWKQSFPHFMSPPMLSNRQRSSVHLGMSTVRLANHSSKDTGWTRLTFLQVYHTFPSVQQPASSGQQVQLVSEVCCLVTAALSLLNFSPSFLHSYNSEELASRNCISWKKNTHPAGGGRSGPEEYEGGNLHGDGVWWLGNEVDVIVWWSLTCWTRSKEVNGPWMKRFLWHLNKRFTNHKEQNLFCQ